MSAHGLASKSTRMQRTSITLHAPCSADGSIYHLLTDGVDDRGAAEAHLQHLKHLKPSVEALLLWPQCGGPVHHASLPGPQADGDRLQGGGLP